MKGRLTSNVNHIFHRPHKGVVPPKLTDMRHIMYNLHAYQTKFWGSSCIPQDYTRGAAQVINKTLAGNAFALRCILWTVVVRCA